MALVFKTPKTAINTTTRDMQNLSADCPPCPECPEVELTTAEVEYTDNGSFTVTPESGFDGLSQVDITVNIDTQSIADENYAEGRDAGISEQKAKLTSTTITQNGTSTREDGWNSVTVNVQPTLQAKTATPTTSQQVITADSGNDGLSQVTVEGVTSAIDANIQPENILEGITILGVEGSDLGYATGYDEGFQAGQEQCGGYQSPWTLNETIPENGTYTFNPSDYCAASDPDSGECAVLSDCFDQVTITVDVPSCPDWSSIGWDCNDVAAVGIDADLAYTVQKMQNDPGTQVSKYWSGDPNLVYLPAMRIDRGTHMFSDNYALRYVSPNLYFYVGRIDGYEYSAVGNAMSLFKNDSALRTIDLDCTVKGDTSSAPSYAFQSSDMFNGCKSLQSVTLRNMDTLTCSGMFQGCEHLTTISLINCSSKPTNTQNMFTGCRILTSIPQIDTSLSKSAAYMFSNCKALTTIPVLDFSSVENINGIFGLYSSDGEPELTTLGGFTNLGKAFTGTTASYHLMSLQYSPKLTKESIMNVINNLAAPDDTTVTNATLKLSAASYALLTAEDIAIATAKNWTVTSA